MVGFFADFMSKGNDGICWSATPYSSDALTEMPSIEMYGYTQTFSGVAAGISNWLEKFKEGKGSYKGLYLGDPTRNYRLPYFNEYHHAVQQSWGAGQGPIGEKMQQAYNFMETAAKVVLPQAGILTPQSYEGSTPATFSFSFFLINTVHGSGDDVVSNVIKNKKFLEQFIHDNLHAMNGYLAITPPLIYEVFIPGVRWSPAATVSSLTVNNKGTLNQNHGNILPGMPKNYIYPDAWEVTVGITELIAESQQIYDEVGKAGSGGYGSIGVKVF